MAKDKRNRNQQDETPVTEQPSTEQAAAAVETATQEVVTAGPNFTLTYRRQHPSKRSSYGIAGNAGIVVIDNGLFPGSNVEGWQPPATITVDCELVPVKADNKTQKAEQAAAKLAERAAKAQAKIEAAQAKAAEKKAKADAAMAAAQAKLKAAQDAATAGVTGGAATGSGETE
jgi:hypothetical protein